MRHVLARLQAPVLIVLLALCASCDDAPTGPGPDPFRPPPPRDTVAISATTTGAAFDSDDYVLLVDGVEIEERLGLNGNVSVSGEAGRTVEVELTDVADNCEVDGAARRSVTFAEGSATSVSYAVHCVAPEGLEDARLVFARGSCDFPGVMVRACDLYALPLDGSERRLLTTGGGSCQPAISADGSAIAFARLSSDMSTDVYAMDVDGENLRRITDDGLSWDPSWSPDGTRIVYVNGLLQSLIFPGSGQEPQIQIRRFNDEAIMSLPTPDGALEPVWSPDGSRIAFSRLGGGFENNGIYTIAPDGGEAALVAAGGTGPVWSPASDQLAYGVDGSVFVVGSDDKPGTLLLAGSQETTWTPTGWSPDGEWIAVTGRQAEGEDVYLLRVDDGTMVRVTVDQRSSSAVFLPGTGGVVPSTELSPLIVHGGVNVQNQNIWIFQGGWNISDGVSGAVVTVNGVSIPNVGDGLYPGYYSGKLPAPVPVGSPLHLRVSARGMIVEATSTVPEATVLTVPDSGAVFDPAGSITVRWTSATDPDRFTIYVNTNHIVWEREVPGTAREFVISASELPGEVELVVAVVAYNDGSFSGPAHPDSRMGTMSSHGPRTVIRIHR